MAPHGRLEQGDSILDLCGPLGQPTDIHKVGTVICVGGGTGIAAIHHIAKGHAQADNRVVSVIGARSADLLLFEEELRKFSHEVLVATDDGSRGEKGFVTQILQKRLEEDPQIKEVVATTFKEKGSMILFEPSSRGGNVSLFHKCVEVCGCCDY